MRKATREIHDISDALVNAKLGIGNFACCTISIIVKDFFNVRAAMGEDSVWAEGLLCFYEIFKYLEQALDRFGHTLLGELDVEGMRRTQAFEEDLQHYYGKEWLETSYVPNAAVKHYLSYLGTLEQDNPLMLSAYVYHLYMGLFSGGQILRKKRELQARLTLESSEPAQSRKGEAVTDFGDIPIHRLKKQMAEKMELIAEQIGEDDRWKLIEESKNVFRLNNKVIRTINTNKVVVKKFAKFTLFAVPALVVLYFGARYLSNSIRS